MYHLYHTPALILGSTPSGEGSKHICLFTREFGLITASAQSAREERSKLRYGLQDFSYSEVALVRGREFWRLTHASLLESMLTGCGKPEAVMIGRVCKLLRRLLAGEERSEALFDAVHQAFQFVRLRKGPTDAVEIVLVLRILHLLGYLAPRDAFDPFLSHAGLWDESVIARALLFRTLAISEINNSLKASQL